MPRYLCVTCGTQYRDSPSPPAACPICEDPRQYVGWDGQQWTTLDDLRQERRNEIREEEPGVYSIQTEPSFAIGQRAFLIQTEEGNVLWDCVALLDGATTDRIRELGGIEAIVISHPHYYTTMLEWSEAFNGAPIYIHTDDRQWAPETESVEFWLGEQFHLLGGLTLVRTGGHFDGYQVLSWPRGADGAGVLFAGDQPQVCMDRRWVTFLYSYPNMIPLGTGPVRRIAETLADLPFDRLYGAFAGKTIPNGAKSAVERSARRYLKVFGEDL